MRPVDKGTAPKVYTEYGAARHDLAHKIGYYCSYCEMKVYNSIEVEHILPQNNGGAPVDWDNFLLSCKYCNTIKSDRNANITDYVWPDVDNTDLMFDYSEINIIEPKSALSLLLKTKGSATINLAGLNRYPGGLNEPTEADTRWRSREEIWTTAKNSYNNWLEAPIPAMARQIASCSLLSGHYSIWREVFKNVDEVLDQIDIEFSAKGLYKKFHPVTGVRVLRTSGNI